MTLKRFDRPPGDRIDRSEDGPPQMEDGVFYDLVPPSIIHGEFFHRVKCEYRVSNHPNEYSVCGIPEGGSQEKAFILRFKDLGRGVRVVRSEKQDFDQDRGDSGPHLRLVK